MICRLAQSLDFAVKVAIRTLADLHVGGQSAVFVTLLPTFADPHAYRDPPRP